MHFYRTLYERVGTPDSRTHHATLAEAHNDAKAFRVEDRSYVRVELIDIQIDKAGVLALLHAIDRREGIAADPIRTWAVSDRGGLYEVANGE